MTTRISYAALFGLFVSQTIACNALLGNDESTNSNGDEGKISQSGSDDTSSTSKDAATKQTVDDGGTSTAARDDSKAPCTSCSSTLAAKGAGHARSVQVDKTHVYFSDSLGVQRIARGAAACLTSGCLDHLVEKSNYSGYELAADRDGGSMCWMGQQTFGCANTATLATKSVSLDDINVGSSITGLTITKGSAYAIYDANRKYIGKAAAAALVGKTGQFGNTVTASYTANGFTVNDTHLAWEETDLSQSVRHVYVRALAGGDSVEIPVPSEIRTGFNRNLALWGDRVYFSRSDSVYVAPIDGSTEAVQLATFHRPGQLVVSAIGVVSACGGDSSGSVHGVEWSPLLPEPPGKSVRNATQLVTAADEVTSVAVADDAIYYSVAPFSGDVGAGVWKIPIE